MLELEANVSSSQSQSELLNLQEASDKWHPTTLKMKWTKRKIQINFLCAKMHLVYVAIR